MVSLSTRLALGSALLSAVAQLAAAGPAVGAPAIPQATAADSALEAQVEAIASQLRCPTCRALSVEDSPSGMALEMRALIRDQLEAGKTPEQIKGYFVERYGEWILLKPKATGLNWTVWLLPVALLAGGFLFVIVTARRWVQKGQARAAALTEAGSEND